jgi:hypothetical protein
MCNEAKETSDLPRKGSRCRRGPPRAGWLCRERHMARRFKRAFKRAFHRFPAFFGKGLRFGPWSRLRTHFHVCPAFHCCLLSFLFHVWAPRSRFPPGPGQQSSLFVSHWRRCWRRWFRRSFFSDYVPTHILHPHNVNVGTALQGEYQQKWASLS